jgi:uncharacterized membrane protein YcaP (DUF421 family)
MGKRQIGDMQPTELVVTLLISEIAAIPLQDFSQPISIGLVAIFMLVLLEIVASVLIMKSLRLRRVLSGKAITVINNGRIDQKAMKSTRMTVFDLVEMLRMQNVFSIEEVDTAVLEINGNLSVCLKKESQPTTVKDLKLETKDKGIALPIISDGKIIDSSLKFFNKDRHWLYTLLDKMELHSNDIFIMTLDRTGKISTIKKEENI